MHETPESHARQLLAALGGRQTPFGWRVRCPAHDDRHPSLDLDIRHDRLLFICRSGCEQSAVIGALQRLDLWPKPETARQDRAGRTVYSYCDTDGRVVAIKERREWIEGGERRKSFSWSRPDGSLGLAGLEVPLYGSEVLAQTPHSCPISLVEGEKCVVAMRAAGFAAICAPNGASLQDVAGWRRLLAPLAGRPVWLWPDADEPGRRHMAAAAAALRDLAGEVRTIEIPDLAAKGDVADYIAAGHDPVDIWELADRAPVSLPAGRFRAPDLLTHTLPPIRWAVPGILPEGLSILGGKPKMGKSWLALDLSLAIASGRPALDSLPVEGGAALYCALEDTPRRLQDRLRRLLVAWPAPPSLELWTTCPRADEGGIEQIAAWLTAHPDARLVVVDTLKRIRPPQHGSGSIYDADHDALLPLAELAHTHRVSLLLIHHLRKMEADDPLDALSGSTGLAAAADGLMILRRQRGDRRAELHSVHREGEEQELELFFDAATVRWHLARGDRDQREQESRAAIETLLTHGAMAPRAIAEALGRNPSTVRNVLQRMLRDGNVRRERGLYVSAAVHGASAENVSEDGSEPDAGAKPLSSVLKR